MKTLFVADFFANEIFGGGELVNEEIILGLRSKNHIVQKINSRALTIQDLSSDYDLCIVGNFLDLKPNVKQYLQNNIRYYIVEHDHKYVINRDVSTYENYIAPRECLTNISFYEEAERVYCQSALHAKVVAKNLNLKTIVNLSTSVWSDDHLSIIEKCLDGDKNSKTMVLGSHNPTKNTDINRKYCIMKNIDHDVVGPLPYEELMSAMSKYESLLFIPKVMETFNRLIVEAKMLNCKILTNNLNGCTSESWFEEYSGRELLEFIRDSKEQFINCFANEDVNFYHLGEDDE